MKLENKKHILLVANTLWSIYNFRNGLIKSLLKDGYIVTVVGPKDEYAKRLIDLGCNVEFIPISSQGKNPFTDLYLLFNLFLVYKKIKPDFIFHYTIKLNIYGSIAAGLTRCNSVAVTTGLGFVFNQKSLLTKFITILYTLSFKFANEVWFLNEEDKKVFLDQKIISKDKAFVLESEGVDTDYFSAEYNHTFTTRSSGVTFLLVARMLWEKGIGIYVEAAKLLKQEYPNINFQLLGACDTENPSAITREKIEMWQREGAIKYLGVSNDIRTYIRDSDCVVLPSFYREGVPRSLMEAASMGKPIITTDNVGCKDVVIDGVTGYLCKIKDVEDLVNAMRKIISASSEEKIIMGNKGREMMINKFDEKIIITTYYNTLKKYCV